MTIRKIPEDTLPGQIAKPAQSQSEASGLDRLRLVAERNIRELVYSIQPEGANTILRGQGGVALAAQRPLWLSFCGTNINTVVSLPT